MDLPVQPPVEPMLAKAATKVPDDLGAWSYEPKWAVGRVGGLAAALGVGVAVWLGAPVASADATSGANPSESPSSSGESTAGSPGSGD